MIQKWPYSGQSDRQSILIHRFRIQPITPKSIPEKNTLRATTSRLSNNTSYNRYLVIKLIRRGDHKIPKANHMYKFTYHKFIAKIEFNRTAVCVV